MELYQRIELLIKTPTNILINHKLPLLTPITLNIILQLHLFHFVKFASNLQSLDIQLNSRDVASTSD